MSLLLKNISQLHRISVEGESFRAGAAMADSHVLENAFVRIKNGRISALGTMDELGQTEADEVIDCSGRLVFPGFNDSHTHIVFPRDRATEYVMRIKGLSYEEIARQGGGILNTAKRLREMSEEELLTGAVQRCWEIFRMGTTSVEVKSGYGLTTEDEIKMLRVARKLKDYCPLTVKTTFLGAHAFPAEYRNNQDGYVDLIINEMIPQVAEEGLADFIDVFCDRGFFTPDQTERILAAGAEYGLPPKIHANELGYTGGVQSGVKQKALSVDHLECVDQDEIAALLDSGTMPTLLPSTAFFLGIDYAPARKMLTAGLPLALASDYNPGSSPSGSMPFVIALACTQMKMLPEEALTACTLNSAYAMGLEKECGSVEVGKRGDLIITVPMGSLDELPYWFTRRQIQTVIAAGKSYDIGD